MDSLFDVLMDDFKRHSNPLSSAMLEAMGTEIARAAHAFAGLPFGSPETSTLSPQEKRAWVGRHFKDVLGQPLNTEPWRAVASEALGRIEGGDDPSFQKLIDTARLQIQVGKQPTALETLKRDYGKRLVRALKGLGLNPADVGSAIRLSREGATVGDLTREFGRGLLYPSSIFGVVNEGRKAGSFIPSTHAAFLGGMEAAISYDPARGKFLDFMVSQQRAAVRAEGRGVKSAFDSYTSPEYEEVQAGKQAMLTALEDLFQKHAGTTAPGTWIKLGQGGETREFSIDHARQYIENLIQNDPRFLWRTGFAELETDPEVLSNLKLDLYINDPRQGGMWNLLESHIKQYGYLNVSSAPWGRGDQPHPTHQMDLETFQKIRAKAEGVPYTQLSDQMKRVVDNLKSVYQGMTAGGFGFGDVVSPADQYFSQVGDYNRFVDDEDPWVTMRYDYGVGPKTIRRQINPEDLTTEELINYIKEYGGHVENLEAMAEDRFWITPSDKYIGLRTSQLRREIEGSPQVTAAAYSMAKFHKMGWKADPHYTATSQLLRQAGLGARSYQPEAFGLKKKGRRYTFAYWGDEEAMAAERTRQAYYRQPARSTGRGWVMQPELNFPQPVRQARPNLPLLPPPKSEHPPTLRPEEFAGPNWDYGEHSSSLGDQEFIGKRAVIERMQLPPGPPAVSDVRNEDPYRAYYDYLKGRGMDITFEDARRDYDYYRERGMVWSPETKYWHYPGETDQPSSITIQNNPPYNPEQLRELVKTYGWRFFGLSTRDALAGGFVTREELEAQRQAEIARNRALLEARYSERPQTAPVNDDDLPDWDEIEEIPFGEPQPTAVRGGTTSREEAMRILRAATPAAVRQLLGEHEYDVHNPARYYRDIPYASHADVRRQMGGVMIFGSAGTGKTQAMSHIAGYRAESGMTDPGRMLFLTGTTTARARFTSRIRSGEFGSRVADMEHIYSMHQVGMRGLERVAGSYDIPADFSHERVMGSLEQSALIAHGLESTGLEELYRYDPAGRYRPEFTEQVRKYKRAFDAMTLRGHTAEDLADEEIARSYQDEFKVVPQILGHVSRTARDFLTRAKRFTLSDLIAKPIQIAREHPEAIRRMYGGMFDVIMADEAHQFNQAGMDLLDIVRRANPNADIIAGGDPLQASIWNFMGGSAENLLSLAESSGMNIIGLRESHRLRQGIINYTADLYDMPQDIRPVSAVDRTVGSAAEQVRSALDLHIGRGPWDTSQAAIRHAKALIAQGVSPADIMIQARTNQQVTQLKQIAAQERLPTFSFPREEDFEEQVLAGRMTYDDVQQKIQNFERPEDAVHVGTIHKSEGLEAKYNIVVGSNLDFQERTPQEKYESRSLLYTAATRSFYDPSDPQSGRMALFSDIERGGLPQSLRDYGALYTATRRAKPLLGPGLGGARELDLGDPEQQEEFIQSFVAAQIKEDLPHHLESRLRTSAFNAARGAINAAQSGEITSIVKDLNEYAVKALRSSVNAFGEALMREVESDTPERRQAAAGLRRATEEMVDFSRAYYGISEESGWLGTGGGPPRGPGDVVYGPSSGGYYGGFGGFSGRTGGGFSWYRMARGMWAARMALSSVQQAFSRPLTEAKQYGTYQHAFAPFAAMEGGLVDSPQYYAIQQARAQQSLAQGAYEVWGPFQEAFARSAYQGGGTWPRLRTMGGTAVGLAMGGAQASIATYLIGSQMGAFGLGGLATIAPYLAVGGAIAGGGLMLAGMGLEAYNRWWKPEEATPETFGKIFVDYDRRRQAMEEVRPRALEILAERTGLSTEELQTIIDQEQRQRRAYAESTLKGVEAGGEFGYLIGQLRFTNLDADSLSAEVNRIAWEEIIASERPGLYQRFVETETLAKQAQQISREVSDLTGETAEQVSPVIMQLIQSMPGADTREMALALAAQSGASGYSLSGYYQQVSNMAQAVGIMPGMPEYERFFNQVMGMNLSPDQLQRMYQDVTHVGGRLSQLDHYFSQAGFGRRLFGSLGMTSQAALSRAGTAISLVQHYGGGESMSALAGALTGLEAPINAGLINEIAADYASYGLNPMDIYQGFAGAGYSTQELSLFARMMGGDINAISYAARTGQFGLGPEYMFKNYLGEPIGTRSGMDFIRFAQARGIGATTPVFGIEPNLGTYIPAQFGITGAQWFQSYLGHSHMPQAYYEAWAEGGLKGAQAYARLQSAQYSLASVGVGLQRLDLQRQFYWGEGSWDQPAPGSYWALEDQLRALQHRSQIATFEYQGRTMAEQWAYQQAQNQITQQRMGISHDYQRWMLDYNRTIQLWQREWTREDWAYADTMSSLGFEWNLEDLNEAIRMATGRERRNLIRQRERLTTRYNLEQEQTDIQRDRQEQLWAMQDQRYEKQVEYTEGLMELERESFELSKEHQETMHDLEVEDFERRKDEYEEERKIQEEMIQMQRKHQAEMMDLQEKSLGIQAAAAQLQYQLAEDELTHQQTMNEELGKYMDTWENEPAKAVMETFGETIEKAGNANTDAIKELENLIDSLSDRSIVTGVQALLQAVNAIKDFKYLDIYSVAP